MNDTSQRTLSGLQENDLDINTSPGSTAVRSQGQYDRYLKRPFDFGLSVILLILFAPMMGIIVLLIYKSSIGRPAFYQQSRVGRSGKPFTMYKFRSMKSDRREEYMSRKTRENDRRITHKTEKDPRHTRLGKFLRKTSIDELPQLVNVVRGEMSLVGPRPEIVEVATHFNLLNHPRHLVRPGITGLWQVSEYRSELLHENVHIDVLYVQNVTFLGDLKILFRTATSILSRTGK